MYIEVDKSIMLEDLSRALRNGGFALTNSVDGYRLIKITPNRCELCNQPALVRHGSHIYCAAHAEEAVQLAREEGTV